MQKRKLGNYSAELTQTENEFQTQNLTIDSILGRKEEEKSWKEDWFRGQLLLSLQARNCFDRLKQGTLNLHLRCKISSYTPLILAIVNL